MIYPSFPFSLSATHTCTLWHSSMHSLHMWTVAMVHLMMCEPLPLSSLLSFLFLELSIEEGCKCGLVIWGWRPCGVFWEVQQNQCDQISLHSSVLNGSLWKLLPGITSNQRLLPIISAGSVKADHSMTANWDVKITALHTCSLDNQTVFLELLASII